MSARVLIADNDPGVQQLLAEVLRRQGFAVTTADDGLVARDLLQPGAFAVLVCDLDMPRCSGNELLSWLARQPGAPPCIVVSGFLDETTARSLADLPCVRALLRKPFDVFAFAATVRRLAAAGEATA